MTQAALWELVVRVRAELAWCRQPPSATVAVALRPLAALLTLASRQGFSMVGGSPSRRTCGMWACRRSPMPRTRTPMGAARGVCVAAIAARRATRPREERMLPRGAASPASDLPRGQPPCVTPCTEAAPRDRGRSIPVLTGGSTWHRVPAHPRRRGRASRRPRLTSRRGPAEWMTRRSSRGRSSWRLCKRRPLQAAPSKALIRSQYHHGRAQPATV